MEQIDARYVLLLNSDIEVSPGWLDPMLEQMDKDESVGACTPRIRDFNRRSHFENAGAAGGYLYDRHEKSKEKAYEEGYEAGKKSQ